MQNVKVERYAEDMPRWGAAVEPEDRSWIMFLGKDGRPELYWPARDENGGVIGDAVQLN